MLLILPVCLSTLMPFSNQMKDDTHGLPLRVTLAWSDYPGVANSVDQVLVEDLDLSSKWGGLQF